MKSVILNSAVQVHGQGNGTRRESLSVIEEQTRAVERAEQSADEVRMLQEKCLNAARAVRLAQFESSEPMSDAQVASVLWPFFNE